MYPIKNTLVNFEHERNPFKLAATRVGEMKVTMRGDTYLLFMYTCAAYQVWTWLFLFDIFMMKYFILIPKIKYRMKKVNYKFRIKKKINFKALIVGQFFIVALILCLTHIRIPQPQTAKFGKLLMYKESYFLQVYNFL